MCSFFGMMIGGHVSAFFATQQPGSHAVTAGMVVVSLRTLLFFDLPEMIEGEKLSGLPAERVRFAMRERETRFFSFSLHQIHTHTHSLSLPSSLPLSPYPFLPIPLSFSLIFLSLISLFPVVRKRPFGAHYGSAHPGWSLGRRRRQVIFPQGEHGNPRRRGEKGKDRLGLHGR